MKYSTDQLKRMRLTLGMTQAEFAKSIGYSVSTYVRWETGGGTPALFDVSRLECAAEKIRTEGLRYFSNEDVRRLRLKLRMTQAEFAECLGVDDTTVQHWENGLNAISPVSMKKLNEFVKRQRWRERR